MTIALSQRFTILERDNFTCRFCGRRAPETELEVDHLHPRSKGGSDDPSNLVTACRNCNSGKGDRVLLPAGPDDLEPWRSLAGKFFFAPDEGGGVAFEGRILAEPSPGYVVAECIARPAAFLSERSTRLVPVAEIAAVGWRLYRTVAEQEAGMHRARIQRERAEMIAADAPDAQAFASLERGADGWFWRIDECPYCGERHIHGGGPLDGDPRKGLGHRLSHCGEGKSKNYRLVEAPF